MDRLARLITGRPWTVLLLLLAVVLAVGSGVRRVYIDRGLDAMMLPEDPDRVFVEAMKTKFGSDEIVVAALVTDDLFTTRGLDKVVAMTRALASIDGVQEVKSLSSANHIAYAPADAAKRKPGGLHIGPLFRRVPEQPDELAEVRKKALDDPLFTQNLVSPDGRAGAFVVYFKPEVDRDVQRQYEAAEDVEAVAAKFAEGGDKVYVSGVPSNKVANARMSRGEMRRLLPILVLANALIVAFIYRSVRGLLIPVGVIVLTLLFTLGLMGHLGIPLNSFTNYVPLFLVMLAATYSVYGVTTYYNAMGDDRIARGAPREKRSGSLAKALSHYASALVAIIVTTAAGFASLATSTIPATRQLGIFTAIGALVLFALCTGFVFAVLSLLDAPRRTPPRPREGSGQALWTAIAGWTTRRPWAVVAAWGAFTVVMALGAPRVEITSNALQFLPYDHPLRVSEREIQKHLGATSVLNVIVQAGKPGSAIEPEVLERYAQIQRFAMGLREVDRSISLCDYLEPYKAALDAEEAADVGALGAPKAPAAARGPSGRLLPATRAEAADMLFVYPYPSDLTRFVDQDRSTLRMVLRLKERSSSDLIRVQQAVEAEATRIGFEKGTVHASSTLLLFGHAFDSVAQQMRKGILTSFLVILPMLMLFTGSLRVGVLAVIPNVIPVIAVFGFMGWFGYHLDFANSTIAAITLGIAVDDTIHFLSHFRTFRGQGHTVHVSLERTLQVAGRGMAFTTGVLTLSLLTFNLSQFLPTKNLGQITAFGFVICLLADLLLMPALLALFAPREWKGEALPPEVVAEKREADEAKKAALGDGFSGEWTRPSRDSGG